MNPEKQKAKMLKAMKCAETTASREEAQKCIRKWEKAYTKLTSGSAK